MNVNFDREMEKIISQLKENRIKPKLLLHACCAPCASSCVERLKEFFEITLYFYNPNMDSEKEYFLRAEEIKKLAERFSVDYIIEEYEQDVFYSAVTGLEQEKEGGARCDKCFNLRLTKTAKKAKQLKADYFATTLTVSPLKNANLINKIGVYIGKEQGVEYLLSDFKKKNGYIRSIEISKELNLYRQNYCGCKFSKGEV